MKPNFTFRMFQICAQTRYIRFIKDQHMNFGFVM